MSIVRVGLGETEKFGQGYDAIFGKKKPVARKPRSQAKKRGSNSKKPKRKK